jgi:methyl-accepting chemotaxis protein
MVQKDTSIKGKRSQETIEIPLFYKMLVSISIVAAVPILLMSIVVVGGTETIIAAIGIAGTSILIILLTLGAIVACSLYLSRLIVNPIVQLSGVANDLSNGILPVSGLPVDRNDEIGGLSRAIARLVNTYRLLDTLAKEQKEHGPSSPDS